MNTFEEIINKEERFELAIVPMTNIVCFRYTDTSLDTDSLNQVNLQIRQKLLEDGEFYIVQTKLRGKQFLRVTVMNPFTTEKHLMELLEKIKVIAEYIKV